MRVTRRDCVIGALGVVIENTMLTARASSTFESPGPEVNKPSVVVTLDIVDENSRMITGNVLIIPDGISPKAFRDELDRQVSDGYRDLNGSNEPRTLILIDPPSQFGIGANLPLSVIKQNYQTHRLNIGPIPPDTSPAKPFCPPTQTVKLHQRNSVSIKVLEQPAKGERFSCDVVVQNDDQSAIYLECFRAELRRETINRGPSAVDRIDDVHVITIDKSGNVASSLQGKDISLEARAWFPISNSPDPLIIESEFLHEVPPTDNRRFRIEFAVSPSFLKAHGFPKIRKDDSSVEQIKQFYRFINVEVKGHFKDDSELSEYNKADKDDSEACDFYVRPWGRFDCKGTLKWAK